MVAIVHFCEKVLAPAVGPGEGAARQLFGESRPTDLLEDVARINQVDRLNFLVESHLVEVVFLGVDFW